MEEKLKIIINVDGVWYHGSNMLFSELRTNNILTKRPLKVKIISEL